jgi:hypothetical protein
MQHSTLALLATVDRVSQRTPLLCACLMTKHFTVAMHMFTIIMQVISEVSALIDSYLRQERTIILAIVPANQDVATVGILERAAAVDPTGARTIGVLTKSDLIDPGGEPEVRMSNLHTNIYNVCAHCMFSKLFHSA